MSDDMAALLVVIGLLCIGACIAIIEPVLLVGYVGALLVAVGRRV